MKKKILLFLTCIFLLAVSASTLFACDNGGKVELKDFPAEKTEQVNLGDFYSLKTSALDGAGKEYRVKAVVTDSQNARVAAVSGEFAVTDINGYTIVYTVTSINATMKVKLNVTDVEKPDVFTLGSASNIKNEVGQEVVLPKIKFKDVGGLVSTSVKLFYLGEENSEVTLTDVDGRYSFVPNKSGAYKIVAKATDTSGNEVNEERVFQVFEHTDFYAPSVDGINGVKIENAAGGKGYAEYVDVDVEREGDYQGAYISLKSSSSEGVTTLRVVSNEGTTEKLHALLDEGYQHVKVWVKAVSENSEPINMRWVATGPDVYPDVPVNEWKQIVLPLKNFATSYDANVWVLLANLNQDGLGEFCIGEISACDMLPENYDFADDQVYAPAEKGLAGIKVENGGGAKGSAKYYSADANRADYTGEYISLSAPSISTAGLTTIRILQDSAVTERLSALQNDGYSKIKIWVKAVSSGSSPLSMTWCANGPSLNVQVDVNEWVQIELPMSNFVTTYNAGVWQTYANLNQNGISEFCIGNISAAKPEPYVMAANQIYAPAESELSGVKIQNADGAQGSAKYNAADASRVGYTDAYISLKSTTNSGRTTFSLVKSDELTKRLSGFASAGYNSVKVWVYVASTQTAPLRNMWCGGVSPVTYADIAVNEWVQIELPLTNFTTTYNNSVWLTSVNLNQNGVEELRIGNMYASNISYVYSPVENGTAGVAVANASGADGSASYVVADATRQGYTGGYISLTATATTGVTTLGLLKIPPVTERLTTIQNEAECTKVKVWVKVVSSNASALRMSWCAGVSPITYVDVPVNEWVQIELPLSNFVTTYDKQVWQTAVNLNQNGITEFCVGDITAVLPD